MPTSEENKESIPQHPGSMPSSTQQNPSSAYSYLTTLKSSHTFQHTFSSQISSVVSTFMFFPVDTIKMRFMSQDGTVLRQHNNEYYRSTFRAIGRVAKEEGVRQLFRGVGTSILGASVAWGSYMTLYRFFENVLGEHIWGRSLVSILSSAVSAFVSNPIWLVKTRMQLEERTLSNEYSTFRRGFAHVIRTGGVRALWRGLSAQLLLSVPNSFYFPIYDSLKRAVLKHLQKDHLNSFEVAYCSVASKTFLAIVSHPLMVLKTRLMDQKSRTGEVQYRSLWEAAVNTAKREGFHGMFRGLTPALIQSVPRSAVNLLVYEAVLRGLTGGKILS